MNTDQPEPPEHLDATARAKWAEILPLLAERGGIDQGVLDALEQYVTAWSRWLSSLAATEAEGAIVVTPQGRVLNPHVGIAERAARSVRQWAGELRLTPARRSAKAPPAAAADPFLRVLRDETA